MNEDKTNFDNKKIKKNGFYKNEKPFQLVDIDVNKILVSKKEHIMLLNTLLDIMIMMLLDHYV